MENQPQGILYDAKEKARIAGAQVAGQVRATLDDERLRSRIPGRSLTIAGLAIMAVAALLGFLPAFAQPDRISALIFLAIGCVVLIGEVKATGARLPGGMESRLPNLHWRLQAPAIPIIFAGLVAVHAFSILAMRLVPVLWAVAAFLICYDLWRRNPRVQNFSFAQAWTKPRRYLLLAGAIGLLSLFFNWSKSTGYFMGGYESRYSSYAGGQVYDYNYTKYFSPGFELTGRGMDYAKAAEEMLFGLILWAAWVPAAGGRTRVNSWMLPAAVTGILSLWWATKPKSEFGAFLFMIALACAAYGTWRLRGAPGAENAANPSQAAASE